MDAEDPLLRLAHELERLAAAQLALGEATERLQAPSDSDRVELRQAAAESRRAARATAEVSARVSALAGARPA